MIYSDIRPRLYKNLDIQFNQFSNTLINQVDLSQLDAKYYESIYNKNYLNGYYKNIHFWEVPLWIATISGGLKNTNLAYTESLNIITNISDCINEINQDKKDFYLFSILDVNKDLFLQLTEHLNIDKKKIIIGGYIDFDSRFDQFTICKDVKSLFNDIFNVSYIYGSNYSLFEGLKIIPRLKMSEGCLHRCKFCTIDNKIKSISNSDIIKQVLSFQSLDFKLIYLDDKTYGQCSNYKILSSLYKIIKEYNQNFEGFIIQTTVLTLKKIHSELNTLHVKYIELGIETFNNYLLKKLNKPQNEKIIKDAINLIPNNVKLIPNILIGIQNENIISYNKTLIYLNQIKDKISHLNIYNLSIYSDSKLAKEIKSNNTNDLNELDINKSFHSNKQKIANNYFYNKIFNFGLNVLGVL